MSDTKKAEAVTGFVHGPYNMNAGDVQTMPAGIFSDLEKVGLVREAGSKAARTPENKMATTASNKSSDAEKGSGEGSDVDHGTNSASNTAKPGTGVTSASVAKKPTQPHKGSGGKR